MLLGRWEEELHPAQPYASSNKASRVSGLEKVKIVAGTEQDPWHSVRGVTDVPLPFSLQENTT